MAVTEVSYITNQHILNQSIRSKQLRVIDADGENLGVLSTQDALKKAIEQDLDLLLIAPNSEPPVARIVDYAKFLYDERKKKSTSKSKKSEVKELRFGPSTGEGDINRFIERAKEFLEDGNRVKITCRMKGREQRYPDVAFQKLKIVEDGLTEVAKIETPAKHMGSMVWIIFASK